MEETVKSSFFARAVAYLIDIFIVSTVAFGLLQVIPVDKNHETSVKGLFAGGDVLPRQIRQIYLAEHDGTVAAKAIIEELNN